MTQPKKKPTKVLLVDDDCALLRSLVRVLTLHDIETETAICAAEARVMLNRSEFDAIVCDQKMPGTCGLDFFTEVRGKDPDLLLFMLSGEISDLRVAVDWAREIGVSEVFSKPCDANKIAETILLAIGNQLAIVGPESNLT